MTLKIKIEVSRRERLGDHQRCHRADHQPARGRPGDPPARGRGQHPGRHPEQAGIAELDRHPRAEFDSHPQIPLRLQGSHHQRRRIGLSGGAARRSFAGARSGESAHHRYRRGPASIELRHADSESAGSGRSRPPARIHAGRAAPALGTVPGQSASRRRRRCWRRCAADANAVAATGQRPRTRLAPQLANHPLRSLRQLPPPAAAVRQRRQLDGCQPDSQSACDARWPPAATFKVPVVLTGGNGYRLRSLADSVRSGQALAGQRGQRRLPGPGRKGQWRSVIATTGRVHDRSMPRARRERPA